MKYFTALADAAFARSAFSAAGLDFDALAAAGDKDAIKNALASAKPHAESDKIKEIAEGSLAAAKKENDELAAQLAAVEAAVGATGIKLSEAKNDKGEFSAEKFDAQHKLVVAKAARDVVTKAGHPGILDDPAIDPMAKREKKTDVTLVGADRVKADFTAQLNKLYAQRTGQN